MKRLNKEFTICFVDFQLSWWNPFISEKWLTLSDALCYLWLIICSLIFVLQFSKELTGIFFQMGQTPVLNVKVGHRFVSWDEWKIFNKSYITIEGWERKNRTFHINNLETTIINIVLSYFLASPHQLMAMSCASLNTKFVYEILVVPFQWNVHRQILWVGLLLLLGVYKKEMLASMKFLIATISSERWFNFV